MDSVREALKNIPPPEPEYEEKKEADEVIEQIRERIDPKDVKIDKDALTKQLMDPKYTTIVQKTQKFMMSQDSLADMIALNSLIILSSGNKIIAGQYVTNLDYLHKARVMFDSPIASIEIGNNQILNLLHRMNKVQIRKYDFSET